MTKNELKDYGFDIKVGKRSWQVYFNSELVIQGHIRQGFHANAEAHRAAVLAATKEFVIRRINGTLKKDVFTFNQAAAKLWSRSLFNELKKNGFLSNLIGLNSIGSVIVSPQVNAHGVSGTWKTDTVLKSGADLNDLLHP